MRFGFYYGGVELHRKEKIVYARFLKPHRVLSTCRLNGGLREDLEYLFNHQSCEPSNHLGIDLCQVAVRDPQRYQRRIASKAGIPYEKSAGLGTAANMNNTAVAIEQFQDLQVVAVTTAGVGTNGGRAGDPASYYQSKDGAVPITRLPPQAGTINTMLFISEALTPGAMVVAATLLAEAKASVLQELATPSRYSEGVATGTGTDQIGIASLLGSSMQHTDANKHSKLGELIGRAARRSLQEALVLQSGLTPDSRRSTVAQLQRFGETALSFAAGVEALLPEEARALFQSNFLSAVHDPLTVAAVQSLVHMRDQLLWKILPLGCAHEVLLTHAAQIASAVSGKEIGRDELQRALGNFEMDLERTVFLDLARRAFAIGYARKWQGRFEDSPTVSL